MAIDLRNRRLIIAFDADLFRLLLSKLLVLSSALPGCLDQLVKLRLVSALRRRQDNVSASLWRHPTATKLTVQLDF